MHFQLCVCRKCFSSPTPLPPLFSVMFLCLMIFGWLLISCWTFNNNLWTLTTLKKWKVEHEKWNEFMIFNKCEQEAYKNEICSQFLFLSFNSQFALSQWRSVEFCCWCPTTMKNATTVIWKICPIAINYTHQQQFCSFSHTEQCILEYFLPPPAHAMCFMSLRCCCC